MELRLCFDRDLGLGVTTPGFTPGEAGFLRAEPRGGRFPALLASGRLKKSAFLPRTAVRVKRSTTPPAVRYSPSERPETATPASDAALVNATLVGDRRARRILARRMLCVPRILSVLNRRRGEALRAHDLEDLAQDALTIIWEKLDTYHGQVVLERWMHRFCFLTLMNRVRRNVRANRREGARLDESSVPPAGSGSAAEQYAAFEDHLTGLSEEDADLVRLKHLERCTFDEIGERLRISPNTAKARYYRALRFIEARLRGTLDGGGE